VSSTPRFKDFSADAENASMPPLIEVTGLCKRYTPTGRWVLENINFTVEAGETLAIIGPSGCGKSTLLKVLAGLESPTQGEVLLRDPNYTLVFQYSALFDSLTVFENVAFSLLEPPDFAEQRQRFKRLPQATIEQMVRDTLAIVGLEGSEDKYPSELSGGMQKRVSFARAILSKPRIIFYDEPTSGLDPLASQTLEDYMVKLSRDYDLASVVVTHTLSTIFRTAQKALLLHEGKVHWWGPVQALPQEQDPIVKRFVQAATFSVSS
jgi:phospholipid/cholesterol/gamma-HCH transport system ATP-binding protein